MFHRSSSHFDQNTPLPMRGGLNRSRMTPHHTLLKPSHNNTANQKNFGSVRRRFGSDLTNTARRPNQSKNLRFVIDENSNKNGDSSCKPQKLLSFQTPQISNPKNQKMAPMTSFVFRQSSTIQPKTLQFATNQTQNKSKQKHNMDSEVEMGPTEKESYRPQMDPTMIAELDTAFDLIGSYRRTFMCNGTSVNEYSYDKPGGDICDDDLPMPSLTAADFGCLNSDLFAIDTDDSDTDDDNFIQNMIDNDCDLPYNDEMPFLPLMNIEF